MATFRVTYSDGKSVDVHAPNEAQAKKHAQVLAPDKIKDVKKIKD